jgi:hypothetical protein
VTELLLIWLWPAIAFALFFALSSRVERSRLRTAARALMFGLTLAPSLGVGCGIALLPASMLFVWGAEDVVAGHAPGGYEAEDVGFIYGLAAGSVVVTSLFYVGLSAAVPRRR